MSVLSSVILLLSFCTTIALNEVIRRRWWITLFASGTYILIIRVLISMIYPKYKKMEITISSPAGGWISRALKTQGDWHAWSLEAKTSGFSNHRISKITTIMFLFEAKEFIRFIMVVDPWAFITIKRIYKLFGHLMPRTLRGMSRQGSGIFFDTLCKS